MTEDRTRISEITEPGLYKCEFDDLNDRRRNGVYRFKHPNLGRGTAAGWAKLVHPAQTDETAGTKTEQDSDPKPCPFCGGKAVADTLEPNTDEPWSVSCTREETDCAGVIYRPNSYYESKEAAIKAWNTRTEGTP